MSGKRTTGRKGSSGEEGVGYGKPPVHTRFSPGQSGNSKGRPKSVRNFRTDLKTTLKARVDVTRDGAPRRVSTQEAALLRLREKALRGDQRALDLLISLARLYSDDDSPAAAGPSADDARLVEVFRARVLSGAASDPAAVERGE